MLAWFGRAGDAEGLACVLREIPRDPEFADLLCDGLAQLSTLDKTFFARSNRQPTTPMHIQILAYPDVP